MQIPHVSKSAKERPHKTHPAEYSGYKPVRLEVRRELKYLMCDPFSGEDTLLDRDTFRGNVCHMKKKGKGASYDRARSSERKRSERTKRRNREVSHVDKPVHVRTNQMKRQVLGYRDTMREIVSGHVFPPHQVAAEKKLKSLIEILQYRLNKIDGYVPPATDDDPPLITIEEGDEALSDIEMADKEDEERRRVLDPLYEPENIGYWDEEEDKDEEEECVTYHQDDAPDKVDILERLQQLRLRLDSLSEGLQGDRKAAYSIYRSTRREIQKTEERLGRRIRNKKVRKERRLLTQKALWKKAKSTMQAYFLLRQNEIFTNLFIDFDD